MVSEDRRSHVRGEIPFSVKFRIIPPEEYEELIGPAGEILSPDAGKVVGFAGIPRPAERGLDTCVINFLLQMDEKLERILSLLAGEKKDQELYYQGTGVNISGSGMNIRVEKPVDRGRIIQARFLLSRFPLVFINVVGEVVRVIPLNKDGKRTYQLAVKFLNLNACDREKIISAVFQRQREVIRRRKTGISSYEKSV